MKHYRSLPTPGKPYACALFLFALNLAVVWRLFKTEFTQHMYSNEGFFMAITRFLVERGFHFNWCPLWFNGVPFENTYSPLLQILDAVLVKAGHLSPAHAFHAAIAFFYCLGPALLFVFAWRLSGRIVPGFLAALVYSHCSPSVVFPPVHHDLGGWLYPRRLHTLGFYGEGAHNVALSLLPLALLLAYLAISRRSYLWSVAAGLLMGCLVLINAFAAIDLVLGMACLAAAQPAGERVRSLIRIAIIGVLAYLWICPFLTPSLIQTLRRNATLGGFHYTPAVLAADLIVAAGACLLWFLTRRLANVLDRFAALFAYVFFAIPALAFFAHIAVFPQPERYHLEMEMGVCLALILVTRHPGRFSTGVLVGLLAAQFIVDRNFARELIQPIDITTTVEYKIAKWMESNLPGERAMISSEAGTWFNAFTDNPQLSSGGEPFSPNWMVQIAVYGIYVTPDPAVAISWLKAFGCHAITVPGPESQDAFKPYRYPRKFDGVLPLLWREGDHAIYAVPQRSQSLAHVVPAAAIVRRAPVNGIDLADVDRFDSALEDPGLPLATFAWQGSRRARINAPVQPGQVLSVQVTYDAGWIATANGRPVPIVRDGIGLMVLTPSCNGPCEVTLYFDGGLERRICRWISLLVMVGVLLGLLLRTLFSKHEQAAV